MSCGSSDESGVLGRTDACICRAESLCCSPETLTTLLTGYTSLQNVFGVKKIKTNKKNLSFSKSGL